MKYKIDLHTHFSTNGHVYSTIEENIRAALGKNLELIAITNHGPAYIDSGHWTSIKNIEVIPSRIESLTILKGVEANFLDEEGNLDINNAIYQNMDLILAGFHDLKIKNNFLKNRESCTKALLAAIEQNILDIIAHPGNPLYPFDYYEVLKAAKLKNIAIEINNSSFRYNRIGSEETCPIIIEIAKELDMFISIGSDSHISYDIGKMDISEKLIKKYKIDENKVLNSSQDILYQFIENRKIQKPSTLKSKYNLNDFAYLNY